MTANATGATSSKPVQKSGRAAPVTVTDTDTRNKAAQSARDPPEAATLSGEDALPAHTLKARAVNVYNAEWTPHEQAALDQAAVKFPPERYQPFERYLRIAATLPRKGVRDVALRLRWPSQARKRKVSEDGPNKRVRRDRCQSIFATQQKPPNMMPQWPQPQMPMPQLDDHGASTVGAVGGLVAQLLEQNLHILYQYKQNMHQFKVQENTELLVRFRDNILAVLNQMSSMDGVMSQMPQLPVRMNVELANNFLPAASSTSPMFPMGAPHVPPGMASVPGMTSVPNMGSIPRMGSAQGVSSGPPVTPMPGNAYMGGPSPPGMGVPTPLSMSAGMGGMPLQSTAMQGMSAQSMQSMGSASMPTASMPVLGHPHSPHSGPAAPVTGHVVKAGPPPMAASAKLPAMSAAAAVAAAAAVVPTQSKFAAQSPSSSSKSFANTAGAQQQQANEVSGQGAPGVVSEQATSSGGATKSGLKAVASAVSSGSRPVSPAATKSTAVAPAKPQSAASKSLAASASKVAAGMANKAAAAKAGKQTKSKP